MTQEDIDVIVRTHWNFLNNQYEMADSVLIESNYLRKQWTGIELASSNYITHWDTGVDRDLLYNIGIISVSFSNEFVSFSFIFCYCAIYHI